MSSWRHLATHIGTSCQTLDETAAKTAEEASQILCKYCRSPCLCKLMLPRFGLWLNRGVEVLSRSKTAEVLYLELLLLRTNGLRSKKSVFLLLHICVWAQIAVEQGFGGVDSQQKASWLIGVVDDFFRDNGLGFNFLHFIIALIVFCLTL